MSERIEKPKVDLNGYRDELAKFRGALEEGKVGKAEAAAFQARLKEMQKHADARPMLKKFHAELAEYRRDNAETVAHKEVSTELDAMQQDLPSTTIGEHVGEAIDDPYKKIMEGDWKTKAAVIGIPAAIIAFLGVAYARSKSWFGKILSALGIIGTAGLMLTKTAQGMSRANEEEKALSEAQQKEQQDKAQQFEATQGSNQPIDITQPEVAQQGIELTELQHPFKVGQEKMRFAKSFDGKEKVIEVHGNGSSTKFRMRTNVEFGKQWNVNIGEALASSKMILIDGKPYIAAQADVSKLTDKDGIAITAAARIFNKGKTTGTVYISPKEAEAILLRLRTRDARPGPFSVNASFLAKAEEKDLQKGVATVLGPNGEKLIEKKQDIIFDEESKKP